MTYEQAVKFLLEQIPTLERMREDKAWEPLQDWWEQCLFEAGYVAEYAHQDATLFVGRLSSGDVTKPSIYLWVKDTLEEIKYGVSRWKQK